MYPSTLPGLDFFIPNNNIINYLKEHHSKDKIVEVGCGRGLFLSLMIENDLNVIGIDIFTRTNMLPVYNNFLPTDALKFNYNQTDIVLLARPCHGHFIDMLFDKIFQYEDKEVYYIGLERNIYQDIDTDLYKTEMILENVGEEEEFLLKVTKR